MAEKNDFTLRIITPDRMFYEGSVKMVEFDTVEGEVGILPGHIPMTFIIRPGVLTITEDTETKTAALHAGFAEVLQDRVTILAEIIEWPEEIDGDRAKEAKERAEERLRTGDEGTDTVRAEIALRRALTRMEVLE